MLEAAKEVSTRTHELLIDARQQGATRCRDQRRRMVQREIVRMKHKRGIRVGRRRTEHFGTADVHIVNAAADRVEPLLYLKAASYLGGKPASGGNQSRLCQIVRAVERELDHCLCDLSRIVRYDVRDAGAPPVRVWREAADPFVHGIRRSIRWQTEET